MSDRPEDYRAAWVFLASVIAGFVLAGWCLS